MDFDSHQPPPPPVLYNEQSVNGHVFNLSAVADPGGGGCNPPPPPGNFFFGGGGGGGRLGPVVETSGRSDPSISAELGDAVVAKYTEEGVVCPPELRRGLL